MKPFGLFRPAFIILALFAASCGSDSSSTNSTPPDPLELTPSEAAFELSSVAAEYFEAIEYGPYDENLFDIYLPASDEPTPLLIYIHGGGFTGGSRDTSESEDFVMSYLAEGIAFASIDYRLLQSPDPDGVIKPLTDSTRALQFIRYHAAQLNIDPDNVILMGGSAGAGTSLWIGFNDDMADPDSEDPVLRQSSRVTALIAIATQGTYDIGKWKTVVFEEYGLDLLELADALGLAQALLDFFWHHRYRGLRLALDPRVPGASRHARPDGRGRSTVLCTERSRAGRAQRAAADREPGIPPRQSRARAGRKGR